MSALYPSEPSDFFTIVSICFIAASFVAASRAVDSYNLVAVDRAVKDLFSQTVDRARALGYQCAMAKKSQSGQHRTRRVAIQVPDPHERADAWHTAAARDGKTLASLVQQLLDQHVDKKKQKRA